MAYPEILARARKVRFDDLICFSEHSSEDVERFLKSIKNITKATSESENHQLLRKKFEQLKQRREKLHEAIITYCDEIINVCREADPQISDSTIIQHLLSGFNPNFRKELSRREPAMNSLGEFLNYTRIEQDFNGIFDKFDASAINPQQAQFDYSHSSNPTLTAAINPSR